MRKIPLIFFFLLTTASFAQINIYVNSAALNGGNGSLGQPYNKIQTAIASALPNSFTIINIAGGTYNENIWIDK
jgi:pectin methylesterase-like acyl-CoA thioesterase